MGRLGRTEEQPRRVEWISEQGNGTAYLWETTKQGQTPSKPSKPLEPATTGAPLPHGDALVTYENLKQEKKCAGSENGYEKMPEMNVVNMLCSGKVVVLCETGMSCPH